MINKNQHLNTDCIFLQQPTLIHDLSNYLIYSLVILSVDNTNPIQTHCLLILHTLEH